MKFDNKLVYISGPITAVGYRTIEENVAAALKVYFKLINHGVACICPHLNAGFPSAFNIDEDTWLEYDFIMIQHCTHLLMLPFWKDSKGAILEHEYGIKLQKIIVYDTNVFLRAEFK